MIQGLEHLAQSLMLVTALAPHIGYERAAAIALAALPADGTERVFAPRVRARVTAADRPRALKELVGFSDSSLM